MNHSMNRWMFNDRLFNQPVLSRNYTGIEKLGNKVCIYNQATTHESNDVEYIT